MKDDIVDVTTNIVVQILEEHKNFQVTLKVVPTEGTNADFLKRHPDGFVRSYDHRTISEAYQTLKEINLRMGLPEPPVPSAEEVKEFNTSLESGVFLK